jgi:hypothetical protein
MEEIRKELAQAAQIGRAASFTRNRGTGEFVHILGSDWPFLKTMAAKGDDGVPDMFDELGLRREERTEDFVGMLWLDTSSGIFDGDSNLAAVSMFRLD